VKEGHIGTNSLFYIYTIQTGPSAALEKFNSFFCKSKFFSSDVFRLWSWGTPGLGLQGHMCAKNLPQVGVEVCTKFGVD